MTFDTVGDAEIDKFSNAWPKMEVLDLCNWGAHKRLQRNEISTSQACLYVHQARAWFDAFVQAHKATLRSLRLRLVYDSKQKEVEPIFLSDYPITHLALRDVPAADLTAWIIAHPELEELAIATPDVLAAPFFMAFVPETEKTRAGTIQPKRPLRHLEVFKCKSGSTTIDAKTMAAFASSTPQLQTLVLRNVSKLSVNGVVEWFSMRAWPRIQVLQIPTYVEVIPDPVWSAIFELSEQDSLVWYQCGNRSNFPYRDQDRAKGRVDSVHLRDTSRELWI